MRNARMGWGVRHLALVATALALGAANPASNTSGGQSGTKQDAKVASETPPKAALGGQREQLGVANPNQGDPYAEERNEREKRDIIAQERSADWAKAMFWAMVVQTIVAFGALCALLVDLRQNRINVQRQLRAYVHTTTFMAGPFNTTDPFRTTVTVYNKGQTPAYEVTCVVMMATRQLPLQDDALAVDEPQEQSVHTLGSGEPLIVPTKFELPFSAQLANDINTGVRGLFCFGRITYVDAFKRNHTTNFRAMWNVAEGCFSGCDVGNDAD